TYRPRTAWPTTAAPRGWFDSPLAPAVRWRASRWKSITGSTWLPSKFISWPATPRARRTIPTTRPTAWAWQEPPDRTTTNTGATPTPDSSCSTTYRCPGRIDHAPGDESPETRGWHHSADRAG